MLVHQQQETVLTPSSTDNNNASQDRIRIIPYFELDHATVYPHLARIKYECFGLGKPFCGCYIAPEKDWTKLVENLYGPNGKHKYVDGKLKMMGIAIKEESSSEASSAGTKSSSRYLGYIQITFHDLPADLEFPLECCRHTCNPTECYIEQIGVSSDARGMGVGTLLMAWAEEQAKQKIRNDSGNLFVSLDVVRSNSGAIRLYEKLGFKIVHRGCVEETLTSCMTIPFIGHRGTYKMDKNIHREGLTMMR